MPACPLADDPRAPQIGAPLLYMLFLLTFATGAAAGAIAERVLPPLHLPGGRTVETGRCASTAEAMPATVRVGSHPGPCKTPQG
jgi:hypothetical protein